MHLRIASKDFFRCLVGSNPSRVTNYIKTVYYNYLTIMQNVIAITIGICSHYVLKGGASPIKKLVIDVIAWSF